MNVLKKGEKIYLLFVKLSLDVFVRPVETEGRQKSISFVEPFVDFLHAGVHCLQLRDNLEKEREKCETE